MFSSTQEAVVFGLQANDNDRKLLSDLRIMFICDFDEAMRRNAFDQATIFAIRAQFCREALDAVRIAARNPELF